MAENWKELKREIDEAGNLAVEECPDDMLRVFEYDIVRTGAGTGRLMMGPWWEGATAARYLGSYYIFNIVKAAQDMDFSTEKIKQLVRLMLPKALGTVALCDISQYADFTTRTMACIEQMEDREEILSLLNALWFYGSAVNAWCQYRMKWGLGLAFHVNHRDDLKYMGTRAGEAFKRCDHEPKGEN